MAEREREDAVYVAFASIENERKEEHRILLNTAARGFVVLSVVTLVLQKTIFVPILLLRLLDYKPCVDFRFFAFFFSSGSLSVSNYFRFYPVDCCYFWANPIHHHPSRPCWPSTEDRWSARRRRWGRLVLNGQ